MSLGERIETPDLLIAYRLEKKDIVTDEYAHPRGSFEEYYA